MYRNYLKDWEPNPIPEDNTNFSIDERTYQISSFSLDGFWFFTMVGVNVPYNSEVELMEYVGPKYDYMHSSKLMRYLKSMCM